MLGVQFRLTRRFVQHRRQDVQDRPTDGAIGERQRVLGRGTVAGEPHGPADQANRQVVERADADREGNLTLARADSRTRLNERVIDHRRN